MFIRTERLLLRPGWPEDLQELADLLADDDVRQNLGVRTIPRTLEALQAYIDRPREPRLPHFFINLRQSGGMQLIGGIGLGRSAEDVELGFWIARHYRGLGYAEEAVRAVLNQARALGHRRIITRHFADAHASAAVLKNAGFQRSGERDERYSAERGMVAPVNVYVADLTKGLVAPEQLTEPSLEAS